MSLGLGPTGLFSQYPGGLQWRGDIENQYRAVRGKFWTNHFAHAWRTDDEQTTKAYKIKKAAQSATVQNDSLRICVYSSTWEYVI
jgi:hypothetical protein